ALHPALGGRLWWPASFTPLPAIRTAPAAAFARSLLSLVNLDLRPSPPGGWGPSLAVAAPGAVALAFLALRGARVPLASAPADPRPRDVAWFGALWMAIAWTPFLLPSVLWQSYYAAFGALGAWLALAMALRRARAIAVPVVLALGLLRGPRSETAA